MTARAPEGLLVVAKPRGITSHDVVDRVRRLTRVRRVGHTGTLDPLASGVLVLCVGRATRLAEYLTGDDKRYRATVRLGEATDSYDAEGAVTARATTPLPAADVVATALGAFRGTIRQVPPPYSAVRQGGERAYDRARRGEVVELPEREVEVFQLELEAAAGADVVLDVHCSSGTYVRSLAHDLGRALGCGAHLAALERVQCGAFALADAVPLERLEAEQDGWRRHLLPMDAGFASWPAVHLDDAEARHVANGGFLPLPASPSPPPPRWRAIRKDGTFCAVLTPDVARGVLRPRKVLP